MRRFVCSSLLCVLALVGCSKAVEPVSNETGIETAPATVETVEELEARVLAGDRDAAFRLGAMYHDGEGTARDFTKARQFFEAAARVGESRSAYNLGIMYLRGEGVEADPVAARRWFARAEELGNTRAAYQLALLSYQGLGALKNLEQARQYFEKSANMGLPEAQYNLGILFIRGEGGNRDPVEGYAWLAVARTYGYAKAEESIKKLEPQLTEDMKEQGQKRAMELSEKIEVEKAIKAAGG